jgi:hypothetical protein
VSDRIVILLTLLGPRTLQLGRADDVVNYTFPKAWPEDREQRARIHRRLAGGAR